MQKTHRLFTTSLALLLGTGLALLVAIGSASAHAKVLSATPGIGAIIATAPTSLTVTTAENINPDPHKSNLFVYAPSGELISQGNAKISLNNPKEMSIAIKASGEGVYIVRWITVSADDGDPDEGAFTFTVHPKGTNSAPKVAIHTPSATTSTGSSSIAPAVLTGILTLLTGLAIGSLIGRRQSTTKLAPSQTVETIPSQDKVASR